MKKDMLVFITQPEAIKMRLQVKAFQKNPEEFV